MTDTGFEIRLLGDPRVLRDGQIVTLPASKKTRALLGYLAGTATAHRREHLCDLLWDGPNDPRAELRWSLNKIRNVLGDDSRARVRADREWVALEVAPAAVDLHTLHGLMKAGVAAMTPSALKSALGHCNGTFLDGLELPGCYRFHHWCLAQREAASRLHLALIRALIDRSRNNPAEALVHAWALATADPLAEDGHAEIVSLLGQLGRRHEAIAYHDHARRLLESEFGAPGLGILSRARRAVGFAPATGFTSELSGGPEASGDAVRTEGQPPAIPLIGRDTERAIIDQMITAAAAGDGWRVLFLTGEPGIGKSRLLDHLADRARSNGCQVWYGRAFEVEAARPFGVWIDALRGIAAEQIPAKLRPGLALIRPDLGLEAREQTNRARLFDSVTGLLRTLSGKCPGVLLFDDIHWFDDASAALFHYVIRSFNAPCPLMIVLTGRSGELYDNPAASQLIRFLTQTNRLVTADLEPLSGAETTDLVRAINPRGDAASLGAESDGNPLLAVTLAHAQEKITAGTPRSLDTLISAELARLTDHAQSLLAWAAALGRRFDLTLLGTASGLGPLELTALLSGVERRRIIRPDGEDGYVFAHDLVQQSIYRAISQPCRRLLHGQIARVLADRMMTEPEVAGDLARHAVLCGEDRLVVRACRIAGSRCLRMFANAEAARFADLGLSHLGQLPETERAPDAWIDLLWTKTLASSGSRWWRLSEIEVEAARAVVAAEASGSAPVAVDGHNLVAFLHGGAGASGLASKNSMRAVKMSRVLGGLSYARQLARTGRCLLEVEQSTGQARALLQEAQAIAGDQAVSVTDLQLGMGLLARWDGRLDAAVTHIERARTLAQADGLRWRAYRTLEALAMVERQRRQWATAIALGAELAAAAAKLGDPSCPFAHAITALAELDGGVMDGWGRLEAVLRELRQADHKGELAYALNAAAAHHLQDGRADVARDWTWQALVTAKAVHRWDEVAVARAQLARLELGRNPVRAVATIQRLTWLASDPDRISARVVAAIEEAASTAGLPISPLIPTRVPTRMGFDRPRTVGED